MKTTEATETMKQTARAAQGIALENGSGYDSSEIWAVIYSDPTLSAQGVVDELDAAAKEYQAELYAERARDAER